MAENICTNEGQITT